MPEVVDTCSLASPASVCRTEHLHLRCSVDFARRVLTGTAALTVQSQEDDLHSLTLDTKDLTIERVVINGQEVKYALGERQSYKGSPMEISLPIALSKVMMGACHLKEAFQDPLGNFYKLHIFRLLPRGQPL